MFFKILNFFNFFKFFKKKKVKNLDISIRNFLSYMLDNVDELTDELSSEYTIAERREFVYNCAINTILEFIQLGKTHIIPIVSSSRMMRLFKENYLLQQFYTPEISPYMNGITPQIIKKFEALKLPLASQDKNDVMTSVNKLITSAI